MIADNLKFTITKCSARNGAGWFVDIRNNSERVAHAHLQDRESDSIEFTWFTVDCKYRKRGIGRFIVEKVSEHFPDKKLFARDIIDSGRAFWNSMMDIGLIEKDK